jgi:hypothetical protein
MKNTSKIFVFLLLSIMAACNTQEEMADTNRQVGMTRAELVEMAAKYGLQDSVRAGYRAKWFHVPENALPRITNREAMEERLQDYKLILDIHRERDEIRKLLPQVKTVAAYFEILDRFPVTYAGKIKSYGSVEKYEAYKKEMLSRQWHIYLNKEGDIRLIPAEKDDNTFPGKRLDR